MRATMHDLTPGGSREGDAKPAGGAPRPSRRPAGGKVVVVWVAAGIAYAVIVVGLFPVAGVALLALSVLPVLAVAAALGRCAGLAAGLLAMPANLALVLFVEDTGTGRLDWTAFLLGHVVLVIAGGATGQLRALAGQMRDRRTALKTQAAGYRKEQAALREDASLLADVLRERTALRAIQSNLAEGLVVAGPAGQVLYWNRVAAELTGLSGGRVLGRSIEEVLAVHADSFEDPGTAALLARAMSATDCPTTAIEGTLVHPVTRDLVATVFPIPAEAPGGQAMRGMLLRDATRERDREHRRDALVSTASHELRTPLTSILGYTELLLRRDPSERNRKEWLRRVHREGLRLAGLVDETLNVARMQSGRLTLHLTAVYLAEVIEEAVESVRPLTDAHRFVTEVAMDLPPVVADRDKLVQVLVNLVDNAVKYSPAGGRVTVAAHCERRDGRAVVAVSDEGIGIAPEDRGCLFAAFQRVRRPETESIQGTGLGLYVTKTLVEMMKGEVWFESALGEGSTFFLRLPVEGDA